MNAEKCECGRDGKHPVPIGGGWSLACDECMRASIASEDTVAEDWPAWREAALGVE